MKIKDSWTFSRKNVLDIGKATPLNLIVDADHRRDETWKYELKECQAYASILENLR